ncbi:hypothetical protein JCM5353_003388 [Sporobolomyces roseus]
MDETASVTMGEPSDASVTLRMNEDSPEPSAPTPIDFSTLRIVREEYDPATWSDLGLDSEPDEDDDIELGDSELQTFDEGLIRVAEYGIYGSDDLYYGKFIVWYIYKDKLEGEFQLMMDALHSETAFIATQLYDGDGEFKDKFLTEGTGVWGDEFDVSPICYLESIVIQKEYRGRGIGTWALEHLWKVEEKLPKTGLENINFLIAFPAPTPHELTDFKSSHVTDPKEIKRLERQEWKHIVDNRINPFLRRAGYRRIGTTRLFCCARDPAHPSKRIPIDQDANEFFPTRPEHEQRHEEESLASFLAVMRQAGYEYPS